MSNFGHCYVPVLAAGHHQVPEVTSWLPVFRGIQLLLADLSPRDRSLINVTASRGPMSAEAVPNIAASISERLKRATEELREIHEQLVTGNVDPRILTDFRDAVNRVRTTAWAVQHSLGSQEADAQGLSVLSLLAAERVRVAYQMCRIIAADLANNGMSHGAGKLVQLYLAAGDLTRQLEHILGREADGWLTRAAAAHESGSAG
jgi:hypothetical protein